MRSCCSFSADKGPKHKALASIFSNAGIKECVMFETEDLVARKNEKHVIFTLLDVARQGAQLGILAPLIVQFEREIDEEINSKSR